MLRAVPEMQLALLRQTGRHWTLLATLLFSLLSTGDRLVAQTQSVSTLAEREMQRRQNLVNQANAQLSEAMLLDQRGQHEEAARSLRAVYDSLPDAGMAQPTKDAVRESLVIATCHWAEQLLKEGRNQDAIRQLDSVLAPNVAPGHPRATRLKKQAEDPDRYPPALTPEHAAKVTEVNRLLVLAGSALDLGDYDKATATYQDVLRLDRYNVAARRGMERAEQRRSEYFDAARDQTRARMLNDINSNWEDAVPLTQGIATQLSASAGGGSVSSTKRQLLEAKIRSMRLPKLQFAGVSLSEVIEFLRLTTRNIDPEGVGISFVLNVDAETQGRSISLDLVDVPAEEVLRYISQLTGTAYRVEDNAVIITSITDKSTSVITKSYRVPPDFIQKAEVGASAGPSDPFAPQPSAGGGLTIRRMGAKEFLESRGVTFPTGASATYSPGTSVLIVRNTADNLALVDTLVEQSLGSAPKQAVITVKMIEVGQENYEELGADIGLGQFNVPGSERVFASGGVTGTQFKTEGSGANATPVTTTPLMTGGLRSSGAILGVPGIAELISQVGDTPSVTSVSPGQFRLLGVFTDPQFDAVVRLLDQKKGTDIITAPSVVTKSGQKASVRVVREFPYPTEFDPPQIPQQVGQGNTTVAYNLTLGLATSNSNTSGPVTPATPTNFEVKELGMVLEVEPTISEDGRTIELSLNPSLTEFEGFIDYGSDISNSIDSSTFNPLLFAFVAIPGTRYTQSNDILQPVFRKNGVNTNVTVYDGSTVVLGGLVEERRVDMRDKVPVLGDIPLVGRLWQSKVTQTTKKNVLFFVTVSVVDPSGQRVNQSLATPNGP